MALENFRKKLDADRKKKEKSPFKKTTIYIGDDGEQNVITEHISYEEWLADQEEYIDNPEDPEYRQMMDGDW